MNRENEQRQTLAKRLLCRSLLIFMEQITFASFLRICVDEMLYRQPIGK
jgi:hypothetical protein